MTEWYLALTKAWVVEVQRVTRWTWRLTLTNGKSGDREHSLPDWYALGTRRHAERKARRKLRKYLRKSHKTHCYKNDYSVVTAETIRP